MNAPLGSCPSQPPKAPSNSVPIQTRRALHTACLWAVLLAGILRQAQDRSMKACT